MERKVLIDAAAGRAPADLVLRNARLVNVASSEIQDTDIAIADGHVVGLGSYEGREIVDLRGQYVCPGFIDGHVHIESSLLSVPEFARVVCARGTAAVITDPHEIANVLGAEGIRYMLSASKYCPIFVYVMVSSCVPASPFETSGAALDAVDIEPLLSDRWVLGIAEMMDYPGVVAASTDCLEKIKLGAESRPPIPIDGHCPGLRGRDLCAYAAAGIATDHECTTLEEAQEKLRCGLRIMIREGSQARNLDALLPLVKPETLDRFMFVTDDKDVEDLLAEGHIDHMVRRAIALGLNPIHAIRLATLSPARHFGLRHLGVVAPGRQASLAVLDDLEACRVRQVYQHGKLVAEDGQVVADAPAPRRPQVLRSSINVHWLEPEHFAVHTDRNGPVPVHVIDVIEDRIDTHRSVEDMPVVDGQIHADPQRDLCKLVVIERHHASGNVGAAFARGFGMQRGAIASSIGHDAHNLLVAGVSDQDMFTAAVHVVKSRGGLAVAENGKVIADVPLPIAGLMSDTDALTVNDQLRELHDAAHSLGIVLRRPFMALSFLSLSVIGQLKVTDQGLVDVDQFALIDLVAKK